MFIFVKSLPFHVKFGAMHQSMHNVTLLPLFCSTLLQPKIGQTGAQVRDRAKHWLVQSLCLEQALPASLVGCKQMRAFDRPALAHVPPWSLQVGCGVVTFCGAALCKRRTQAVNSIRAIRIMGRMTFPFFAQSSPICAHRARLGWGNIPRGRSLLRTIQEHHRISHVDSTANRKSNADQPGPAGTAAVPPAIPAGRIGHDARPCA